MCYHSKDALEAAYRGDCYIITFVHHFWHIGYLYITGRIKEILITRGGENIAPVLIEEKMMDQMKLLSYCMVLGDNQKYLTMFVTLRCEVGVVVVDHMMCM